MPPKNAPPIERRAVIFRRKTPTAAPEILRTGIVAMTGANGTVARLTAPHLAPHVARWRLIDRAISAEAAALFTGGHAPQTLGGDLADPPFAAEAMNGAAALVHFAGFATEAAFATLRPSNIEAAANLFAAAAEAGVRHVVLASSMHVMGFYDRAEPLDESMPPRPDSLYAVTKLFAENLGALYADKAGMSVTALRLGHVCAADGIPEPGNHIAPEDVARLVLKALAEPSPGFRIVHATATPEGGPAVSDRRFLADSAFTTPREPAAEREARLRAWWGKEKAALKKRGGIFAAMKLPPIRES